MSASLLINHVAAGERYSLSNALCGARKINLRMPAVPVSLAHHGFDTATQISGHRAHWRSWNSASVVNEFRRTQHGHL
jgi:hypothetical protein